MVILKRSVSDRLGAPRARALARSSDRRVHGCLNPSNDPRNVLRAIDLQQFILSASSLCLLDGEANDTQIPHICSAAMQIPF